jgi:hypothetical protein
MTAREVERLRAVEENQRATNDKLDYLIERFDKYVDEQNKKDDALSKKFITRAEAVAVGVFLSIAVTLITLWINLKDHVR